MKYSILIILTSFLSASDIKNVCEEYLLSLYPENTDIRMHILTLDKQIKKKVENHYVQNIGDPDLIIIIETIKNSSKLRTRIDLQNYLQPFQQLM